MWSWFCKGFLIYNTKNIHRTINKFYFIKIKYISSSKALFRNWEKIVVIHTSVTRTYTECIKKFQNSVRKKYFKWFEQQTCHQEDIWVANKHNKRCWTPLVTKKMHIKLTMKCHYTSIRKNMLEIWRLTISSIDENVDN